MKILLFLLSFFLTSNSYSFSKINLDASCDNENCLFIEERVKLVLKNASSKSEILEGIRFSLNDNIIKKFEFSFKIMSEKEVSFKYQASLNSFIQNVNFQLDIVDKRLISQIDTLILPYKGKIFTSYISKELKGKVLEILRRNGFLSSMVDVQIREKENRVSILLIIKKGEVFKIDQIKIITTTGKKIENENFFLPLRALMGAPWKTKLVEETVLDLINKKRRKGFYDFNLKIESNEISNKKVKINLVLNEGIGHNFFISGTEKISKIKTLNYLKERIYQGRTRVGEFELQNILQSYLKENGFYASTIKISQVQGRNAQRKNIINHFIKIKENGHTRLAKINFNGIDQKTSDTLNEIIDKNQSDFHLKGYYLESDFIKYNTLIEKYLASLGYGLAEVTGPFSLFSDDKKTVSISFKIHLGTKVSIRRVNLGFSEKGINLKIKKILKNVEGGIFFSGEVQNDIEKIINLLKANGYFYASVKSNNKLFNYSNNFQVVDLNLGVQPGNQIRIRKIEIKGLNKTKEIVIRREISAKEGDLLTPSLITKINDEIVPLNLFSFVSVGPSKTFDRGTDGKFANLVIQLKERDYGVIRLSPGYRSDLGFKVESLFQRNNIMGKNESFSLNLRANSRTSLSYLDSRRQGESKDILEFSGVSSYVIPYILQNKMRLQFNTEVVRRRFYGFDADIGRVGMRLTKNFNQYFGSSIKYQFENIKQYDATLDSDKGYFRIGSILGSFYLDFRDRVVNPSKGSYHGISFEVGNPSLLSMDTSDLQINFAKVVTRNRLYYSFSDFIFAMSISAGFQKNLANELYKDSSGSVVINPDGSQRTIGFLPSVKVFRLEGIDGVRGFSEEEINRLSDGDDILSKRIQGEAFMLNSKFEIRKLLSDSVIGALFFDAGRLYVDSFKPLKLRRSAGVSFKFLTPVGTLDFDYGLKLDRKSDAAREEMFGRFHLAIGFF